MQDDPPARGAKRMPVWRRQSLHAVAKLSLLPTEFPPSLIPEILGLPKPLLISDFSWVEADQVPPRHPHLGWRGGAIFNKYKIILMLLNKLNIIFWAKVEWDLH